jgi:hypothetical protein
LRRLWRWGCLFAPQGSGDRNEAQKKNPKTVELAL